MAGKNYRDLVAWQEAMNLVMMVYQASADLPKEELYGLRSQMRRAAVSIPSNIAEGQGRRTRGEFRNFLSVAHGSLREVETQFLIARRLDYLTEKRTSDLIEQAGKVGRLVNGLSNSLSQRE